MGASGPRRGWLGPALALAAFSAAAALPDRALTLRNDGLAQLENEQPARAEEAFRELASLVAGDPLPAANLAIALLRQQRGEEPLMWIDKAVALAPGRGDLLAIRGEVLQWSGRPEEALAAFQAAAAAAPDDPVVQYALLRQTAIVPGPAADSAAGVALERLARLRPENLLVLLQQGSRALARGDRAAATAAYLRVRELAWQAPEIAAPLVEQVLDALEAADLAAARLPAMRLENVLKVAPMYREGLRELSPGIQGVPIERFASEPAATRFGDPVPVRFVGRALTEVPATALASGDFDGDQKTDLAWGPAGGGLVVALAGRELAPGAPAGTAKVERLAAFDLDNDGKLELLGYGDDSLALFGGKGDGSFAPATEAAGLAGARGRVAVAFDFDIEGDLDLALAGGEGGIELYRNALAGPLEPVGEKVFTALGAAGAEAFKSAAAAAASDLDRDGDLDLVLAGEDGLVWLDNLRQGEFANRSAAAGLVGAAPGSVATIAAADLDNDGWPDLAAAGTGLTLLRNDHGRFAPWRLSAPLATTARFTSLAAADFDNDGRLDLAVAGPDAVVVLAQRHGPAFRFLSLDQFSGGADSLVPADLDSDGDVDLAAAGPNGVLLLDNQGGNANRWLAVRLRGLTQGSSKNNVFGLGSVLEVRAGRAYQFREATADVVHFGLGSIARPDLLRVMWTNGVPQNRLAPEANQWVVEEQLLKGSCPFLYAWDGERVRFVTDLLWASPLGLPVAEGVWAGADPSELVRVDGAAPRDGIYDLRLTEELWEAAFLDEQRLWVVDHPAEVEVASNLRVMPGAVLPEAVLAARDVRAVAAAWDARGTEATARVRERDDVYADGWEEGRYQGLAAEPWSFTFDLGEAPGAPVRLLLDGWIFPADASLNLAIAQDRARERVPTRLEVETARGWEVLVPEMGFPAGKTKTMVVDTPPLPAGAQRLRIVSDLWLSWDRIAWSAAPEDDAARVVARLAPRRAELAFRGFSALVREAPNAPHAMDYARVATASPWLPFPGRYTRYGDVRELLADADDRSVVLAAGDELVLEFDASALPAPPAGWRRTVFLETTGWDKDADRNTWAAAGVEPLPFRAMSGYPYGPGEAYPDTPLHRRYLEEWLTRVVRD
jgi:Tfp pilus assembly protein PilF